MSKIVAVHPDDLPAYVEFLEGELVEARSLIERLACFLDPTAPRDIYEELINRYERFLGRPETDWIALRQELGLP